MIMTGTVALVLVDYTKIEQVRFTFLPDLVPNAPSSGHVIVMTLGFNTEVLVPMAPLCDVTKKHIHWPKSLSPQPSPTEAESVVYALSEARAILGSDTIPVHVYAQAEWGLHALLWEELGRVKAITGMSIANGATAGESSGVVKKTWRFGVAEHGYEGGLQIHKGKKLHPHQKAPGYVDDLEILVLSEGLNRTCAEIQQEMRRHATGLLRAVLVGSQNGTEPPPIAQEIVDGLKQEYADAGGTWGEVEPISITLLLEMPPAQVQSLVSLFSHFDFEFGEGRADQDDKSNSEPGPASNRKNNAKQIIEDLTTGDGRAKVILPNDKRQTIRLIPNGILPPTPGAKFINLKDPISASVWDTL